MPGERFIHAEFNSRVFRLAVVSAVVLMTSGTLAQANRGPGRAFGTLESLSPPALQKTNAVKFPKRSPEHEAYIADICGRLELEATKWKLPPGFFARLIWIESRFNPDAVSYKGAEGIAQFMPFTARLRGLDDAFDPASAISASARFLSDLRNASGNLGLAAAAYNAGSKRVQRWLDGKSNLPLETKNYVRYITGLPARDWKKSRPPKADFILNKAMGFQDACRNLPINLTGPKPLYAKAHYNKAIKFFNRGEFDKAITRYNSAIKLYPRYVKAHYNRAIAYYKNGDFTQAIADYNTTIKLKPVYAAAYNNRGVIFRKKGEYTKAIADFSKAIKLNPKYSKAYYNRAIVFHKNRQFHTAIADYSRAIKIFPKYAAAHNNRAIAYHKTNKFNLAIAGYNQVIKLNPKYSAAYFNRGVAYRKKGNYKQAIADYNTAIKLDPRRASAFGRRGSTYVKLGERDRAIADFRKAIELHPENRLAIAGLKRLGLKP